MSLSHYQTEFDKMINRDYFSHEVNPLRKDAFSKFIDTGFPTQKWEDWRFTNLSHLKNKSFRISDSQDVPPHILDVSPYKINDIDTIIIYNGHYQEKLSSVPEGVQLMSGIEYFEKKNGKIECKEHTPFDLLNTAFMDIAVCFVVEPNTIVETPVRILFISDGESSVMVNPRIYIDMKESAALTFIEHHVGDALSFFQNESVFLSLESNSFVDHIRIQSNSTGTLNIANLQVNQEIDSHYSFFHFAVGSQLGRTNIHCELKEKGSECDLNGLALLTHANHLDDNIQIDHVAPNCQSNQSFKSILKDESSGVFNSRIIVQKGAQKSDAKQSNKNLLLSKKAVMNSNPQLDIKADDVKCAHSSATGALDEEALFYLRSRGLDIKSSEALMIRGFALEQLELIKNKNIFDYLMKLFQSWLKS